MDLRKPKMRITTAEWIDKQRRDMARFVMGRPYIVMLDESTQEHVYHPVELIDSESHQSPEVRS